MFSRQIRPARKKVGWDKKNLLTAGWASTLPFSHSQQVIKPQAPGHQAGGFLLLGRKAASSSQSATLRHDKKYKCSFGRPAKRKPGRANLRYSPSHGSLVATDSGTSSPSVDWQGHSLSGERSGPLVVATLGCDHRLGTKSRLALSSGRAPSGIETDEH